MENTSKRYRIMFTDYDLFMGHVIEKEFGTKWMSYDEMVKSQFLSCKNARVIEK